MDEITVGIDDSQGARRALAWALDLAAATGATVHAVHVYTRYVAWVDRDQSIEELERARQVAVDAAERELAEVVAEVVGDRQDVEVTQSVAFGGTAPALVEQSAGSDLLVVGSRGRGALAGLVLGSVSRRCTESARCPVVVVPTGSLVGG